MGYPLGVPFIGRNKKPAENQRVSKFVSGERGYSRGRRGNDALPLFNELVSRYLRQPLETVQF